MFSNDTKQQTKVEKNSTNIEVDNQETEEQQAPEQVEGQPVNLGELGNYFDVVRNNYFEVNRVIFIIGPITWENMIHVIQKLSFYDEEYFEVDFNADLQHKYHQLNSEKVKAILGGITA